MQPFVPPSFGWRPDLPDFRDFTPATSAVADLLKPLKARRKRDGAAATPKRVDLRQFFPEALDQGTLPASPAHACTALLSYFERRSQGHDVRPSRMFAHYTARRMAESLADNSVGLRQTIKAIVRCGAPPERLMPYEPERGVVEPDAFLYSFTAGYRDLRYVRLDARDVSGTATLEMIKAFLAAGFPSAFGVSIPTSISRRTEIVYRPTFESVLGGQALVAVGYNDQWLGSSRGALLVRNSWGTGWGKNGYGWLPYAFVESRLAVDFWTLLNPNWLDSGEFQRPWTIRRGE